MRIIPWQPVAGAKSSDTCAQLALLAFEALSVPLSSCKLRQKSPHQRRDRRILLRSSHARPAVCLVVYGNCDILHIFTVSGMVKPVKLALTSPADSVSKVKRTVFATARLPPGGDAAFETAPIGDAYALRKLPAPIGVWISATATRC